MLTRPKPMIVVPGSIPRMILSLSLRGSGGESCTVFCYIYPNDMFSQHTQRFSVALKVAIVFLAAGYIAWRFGQGNEKENIAHHMLNCMRISPLSFLAVFLLMPLNWMLEGL